MLKDCITCNRLGSPGMPIVISEKLDKLYVCKQCKTGFIFKADIEDHMQRMPKHQDAAIVQID